MSKPKLWSDFDGTAVKIAKKTNPRNWSKYPLPGIAGYADFLSGVTSTGVEIAGIVSRRPDILVRRLATARSVTKLGLGEHFPDRTRIVHTGSETAKGRFIMEQSRAATIGMLEDKPHKLGPILLGALMEALEQPDVANYEPIVVGVVPHERCDDYIDQLYNSTRTISNDVDISFTGSPNHPGITFKSGTYINLSVVPLDAYDHASGEAFGQQLLEASI